MRNMEVSADGSFALRCPDYVDAKVLAASTAEAIAVPTGATHVVLQGNVDFYARYNDTGGGTAAAVPTDTADGTACEMNPTVRLISGKEEISVISAAIGIVTAAFYKS